MESVQLEIMAALWLHSYMEVMKSTDFVNHLQHFATDTLEIKTW